MMRAMVTGVVVGVAVCLVALAGLSVYLWRFRP